MNSMKHQLVNLAIQGTVRHHLQTKHYIIKGSDYNQLYEAADQLIELAIRNQIHEWHEGFWTNLGFANKLHAYIIARDHYGFEAQDHCYLTQQDFYRLRGPQITASELIVVD